MQATFVLDFYNTYNKDSVMISKIQNIPILNIMSERQSDFDLIVSDITIAPSTGYVRRTIVIELKPDYEIRFPTDNNRRDDLRGTFKSYFGCSLPGTFEESVTLFP